MTDHTETEYSEGGNGKRRRGIYLLPNLFTTANLFAGFYGIVASIGGRFEAAAIAIFVAMVMDGLDGRVARMTNTQSDFGKEYDSLVDMVAFGLAPALIMYEWALQPLGKLGWLAAFVYAAAGALRLARFNTQVSKIDKRYFQGLASPAAAGLVAGLVWIGDDFGLSGRDLSVMAFIVTVAAGALMVSNVRYRSFKELDLKGRVPFVAILSLVMVFALISLNPPSVLFTIFLVYALSGPAMTLFYLRQKRQLRKTQKEESEKPGGGEDS
jgi:CDP-diacylglycerol--serine O-phosphatidyltransferase